MMRYSVQPRDRIFVKGYGYLSFAKNKNLLKTWAVIMVKNVLIILNSLP